MVHALASEESADDADDKVDPFAAGEAATAGTNFSKIGLYLLRAVKRLSSLCINTALYVEPPSVSVRDESDSGATAAAGAAFLLLLGPFFCLASAVSCKVRRSRHNQHQGLRNCRQIADTDNVQATKKRPHLLFLD